MLVCFLNSPPNGKYSNLSAFSNSSFSSKISSPIKNSNLLTFPYDKAEMSASSLSKLF